jgi:four helix bundle protein
MSIAKAMPGMIEKWPRGYYYLSDQLKRATSSIILNIAEGNGRTSTLERKRFFTIAMASASEVDAIIETACAYRLISQSQSNHLRDLLLQIYKMLYKLK